jgi:epoxyqueuosine reductase
MLDIQQRALEIGFDLAGVAPLGAWKDLEFSRRWLERGFGGKMRYLANPQRHDPRSILPSVQSVVCVGLVYNAPLPYSEEVRRRESEVRRKKPEGRNKNSRETQFSNFHFPVSDAAGPRAWISRYAWGRDYHEIMRSKLEALRAEIEKLAPEVETRVFVDTGPIVERAFARLSGIGWMGKNTCLINKRKGSWFFLGVILTNLALEPDLPAPDRCGSCTACLDACPTGALVVPYVMDASRCISYLNIELKGAIPEEFRALMGNNVFGCDICQDVCPWNGRSQESEAESQKGTGDSRAAATTTRPEFQPLTLTVADAENGKWKLENGNEPAECESGENRQSAIANRQSATDDGQRTMDTGRASGPFPSFQFPVSLFNPPLAALARLTEDDFRRFLAHSPIKRAKYRGWLRNLCVAMGNSGDARFVPKLQEFAAHAEPLVREHAAWALARLRGV